MVVVDQTQEAQLQTVNVDVSAGSGQTPKFDIDVADVSVGSTEVGVAVPNVDVKTETRTGSPAKEKPLSSWKAAFFMSGRIIQNIRNLFSTLVKNFAHCQPELLMSGRYSYGFPNLSQPQFALYRRLRKLAGRRFWQGNVRL